MFLVGLAGSRLLACERVHLKSFIASACARRLCIAWLCVTSNPGGDHLLGHAMLNVAGGGGLSLAEPAAPAKFGLPSFAFKTLVAGVMVVEVTCSGYGSLGVDCGPCSSLVHPF